MRGFLDDLRFSIRLVRRAPAMSAAVMASLALGIGWLASWLPARNASSVDPLAVLRQS